MHNQRSVGEIACFGIEEGDGGLYLLIDHFGNYQPATLCDFMFSKDHTTPAWSLHRLIEILGVSKMAFNMDIYDSPYEEIIHRIEIFVNAGEFNKEYLEGL